MKNKFLEYSLILIVAVIVIAAGVMVFSKINSFQKAKAVSEKNNNPVTTTSTTTEAIYWASSTNPVPTVYVQKPIKLELMSADEKKGLRLSATSTPDRIQILSRDKNGKVNAYRLIKKDADILKEY